MRYILMVLLGLLSLGFACAQVERYDNPVDKKSYVASGGWKTYSPTEPSKAEIGKVSLDHVRFLQSNEEIGSRTRTTALAAFIKAAQGIAADVFASSTEAAALMVQFTCAPDKCSPEIAYKGTLPTELLQSFYDKLSTLQPLEVSGEIEFQFTLNIEP